MKHQADVVKSMCSLNKYLLPLEGQGAGSKGGRRNTKLSSALLQLSVNE